MRETLTAVKKRGRPAPGLQNPVAFPDELYCLWHEFLAIRASQPPMAMGGAAAIRESEIRAFCENRRTRFSRFELNVVRALDDKWLSVQRKK